MNKQHWARRLACLAALGAVALGFQALPARADQIYIQQSGSSPAGGEPNIISNTGAFNVGDAGNHTLTSPLLIIVGVYDGNGTPSISFSGCTVPATCPAATVGTYGLTSATGSFTASSTGDAFDQLGLQSGGSENWTNWTNADVANGFKAPKGFTLYAFAVDASLVGAPGGGTPISIDESGAANGSFIIAMSCQSGDAPVVGDGCGTLKKGAFKPDEGDVGQTVFTNTGFIDAHNVPEPGTLLLFAVGLAGLGVAGARRRSRAVL